MNPLSERERLLLNIVEQGEGALSSREVDIRYSQRMPHIEETVFEALDRLAAAGLVTRHVRPGTPHDRYEITTLRRIHLGHYS